jgi:hypothetical protein
MVIQSLLARAPCFPTVDSRGKSNPSGQLLSRTDQAQPRSGNFRRHRVLSLNRSIAGGWHYGSHRRRESGSRGITFRCSKRRNRDVEIRRTRHFPANHRGQSRALVSRFGCAHWHSGTVGMKLDHCAQSGGASLQMCRRPSTRSHRMAFYFLLIRCTSAFLLKSSPTVFQRAAHILLRRYPRPLGAHRIQFL